MSLEADLLSRLKADATVAGIVGAKVYVETAPQHTALPYLIVQVISTTHTHHTTSSAEVAASRVQVDAWTDAPSTRAALIEAVRQSMQSHRGELVSGGTWVHHIGFSGPDNSYDRPPYADEAGAFRGLCELSITYAVPALS